MTEDELRAAADEFRDAPRRAAEKRDAAIRAAHDDGRGLGVMEISRVTGFSRETVRLALDPEKRAAVQKAAADRRAAR